MENKELSSELSLLDLWLRLWKNKYLIIILTFIITIIGLAGIIIFNRSGSYEQVEFKYHFDNASRGRFPNEELFDYRMINSAEFLEIIKQKNEDFKDVNIESLIKNDKTLINFIEVRNSDGNIINTYHQIQIPTSIFKNNKYLAREFARKINDEIISMANEKKNEVVRNFLIDSDNNDLTVNLTYVEVITEIKRQYNELINKYDFLINQYNDPSLRNGVLLSEQRERLSKWYNTEVYINELENEVITKGYIWNEAKTINKLRQIEYLDKKISNNNKLLDDYEDRLREIISNSQGVIGTEPILDEIVKLIKENHYLELEKEYYETVELIIFDTKENINDKDFDLNVQEILDRLDNEVVKLNSFAKSYSEDNYRIEYIHAFEFETIKPLNTVLMAVVVIVLAGSISIATAFIKEAILSHMEEQ